MSNFSELTKIQNATNLLFDENHLALKGIKHDIQTEIFDSSQLNQFVIYLGLSSKEGNQKNITSAIYRLSDSLPKNTIISVKCLETAVEIRCKSFNLIQENLPLLIEFLEKLTFHFNSDDFNKSNFDTNAFWELSKSYTKEQPQKLKPKKTKIKLNHTKFNLKGTLKGILGGIIGLIIGGFIWTLVTGYFSSLFSWLGGIIMTATIFFLYTKFSKKMQIADTFIVGFLILAGTFASNYMWAMIAIFGNEKTADKLTIYDIIGNFSFYSDKYQSIINQMNNNILVGMFFVVGTAIASYMLYYYKHSHEMY